MVGLLRSLLLLLLALPVDAAVALALPTIVWEGGSMGVPLPLAVPLPVAGPLAVMPVRPPFPIPIPILSASALRALTDSMGLNCRRRAFRAWPVPRDADGWPTSPSPSPSPSMRTAVSLSLSLSPSLRPCPWPVACSGSG